MPEHDLLQENNDLIQKLMHIPGLKSFKEEDVKDLLRMSKIRKFNAGELIFQEGSFANLVYYLVSGKAKILKNEKELKVLHRTGDVFGEMGSIAGSARSASVFALDETVCIEIDISDLDRIPGDKLYMFRYLIFRGFAEILASRLKITTEELVHAREEIARLQSLTDKT
jgi:CRP-like cAMP-binding protein